MAQALEESVTDTPEDYEILTEEQEEKKRRLQQEVRLIVKQIDDNDCHPTKCSNQLRRIFEIFYDKEMNRTLQTAVGDALAAEQFADCTYKLMKAKQKMGYFPSGLNRSKNVQLGYTTYDIFDNTRNYSDSSKLFNNSLMETDIVEILLDNLVKYPNRNPSEKKEKEYFVIESTLSIITNLAQRPENRVLFSKYKQKSETTGHGEKSSKAKKSDETQSKHNIVKMLREFNASKDKRLRMLALCSLAGIADKEEIDKITKDFDIVKTMVQWMSCAIELGEGSAMKEGYTATTICDVIDKLAINGNIEVLLNKTGLLPALYRMLESNDVKQMISASKCLWRLAFDDLGKKKIKTEMMDTINKSKTIPETLDRLCLETTNEQVFRNVEGALFTLYGKRHLEELTEKQIPKVLADKKRSEKMSKRKKSGSFIFLSYCWNEQDIVLEINKMLVKRGFDVWIDVNEMTGSILDCMAYAVENATLTLMCVSEGYKQSHNCRLEAHYVDKLRKDFIPVMVSGTKTFDGWLALLLESRVYIEHQKITEFPKLEVEIDKRKLKINKKQITDGQSEEDKSKSDEERKQKKEKEDVR